MTLARGVAHALLVVEVRVLADDESKRVGEMLPLNRLGRPTGEYLVAWEDGDPVGHAHIEWALEPPELQDVFVAAAHRRRGIATALTEAAEERVRARGGIVLALTVGADNTAAQALYRKLGYVRTAEQPRRVQGTVQLRTGPIEVDDVLLPLEKRL
jgi:ribosomal protein S18 acetylase RimI-like enzyme